VGRGRSIKTVPAPRWSYLYRKRVMRYTYKSLLFGIEIGEVAYSDESTAFDGRSYDKTSGYL
jgi:hypothetical protein